MLNRAWILVAVLALPSALQAQRGRKYDPLPSSEGEFAPPPMPSAKDMEKRSPAASSSTRRRKCSSPRARSPRSSRVLRGERRFRGRRVRHVGFGAHRHADRRQVGAGRSRLGAGPPAPAADGDPGARPAQRGRARAVAGAPFRRAEAQGPGVLGRRGQAGQTQVDGRAVRAAAVDAPGGAAPRRIEPGHGPSPLATGRG